MRTPRPKGHRLQGFRGENRAGNEITGPFACSLKTNHSREKNPKTGPSIWPPSTLTCRSNGLGTGKNVRDALSKRERKGGKGGAQTESSDGQTREGENLPFRERKREQFS